MAVDRPPQHCAHLDVFVQTMGALVQQVALARQVAQVAQEIQALQVMQDALQLDYPKPLMVVRQATEVMLVRRGIQARGEREEAAAVLDCDKLALHHGEMLLLVQPDLRAAVQEALVGTLGFHLLDKTNRLGPVGGAQEIAILALMAQHRHDQHQLTVRLNLLAEHRVVELEGKVLQRVDVALLRLLLGPR